MSFVTSFHVRLQYRPIENWLRFVNVIIYSYVSVWMLTVSKWWKSRRISPVWQQSMISQKELSWETFGAKLEVKLRDTLCKLAPTSTLIAQEYPGLQTILVRLMLNLSTNSINQARGSSWKMTRELAWHLVASREIPKGEGITFDYTLTEYSMVEPFDCLCKSNNCLGKVQGFKHLSGEEKKKRMHKASPVIKELVEKRQKKRQWSDKWILEEADLAGTWFAHNRNAVTNLNEFRN